MSTYFKDKNSQSKKKNKNNKKKTTKINSFDTNVILATTSSSFTFSLTGFGLQVIPISSSLAFGFTISNKILYDMVMQKYKKNRKTIWKRSSNN